MTAQSALPGLAHPRVVIGGAPIDALTLEEAVSVILARAIAGGPPAYVVTPNAAHLATLQENQVFQAVYRGAWLSVADGLPLVWASRLLHTPLPGRVNGTDLFERLCAGAAERGLSVFLLGGRPGAADAAAEALRRRHPRLLIAGTRCPPPGFERDIDELGRVDEAIRAAHPALLFVGLGAPKQEFWIASHGIRLGVPVALGIGVSFEFVGGMVRRAPRWMQRTGLEWFYRLLTEPRRLWRRYLFGNITFLRLVARQWWAQRYPGADPDADRRP